jgi:hypothetical protein
MKRVKIFLTMYIDKLYKLSKKKKPTIWIEVPMFCSSVEEKSNLIYSTMNFMERKITIKNN